MKKSLILLFIFFSSICLGASIQVENTRGSVYQSSSEKIQFRKLTDSQKINQSDILKTKKNSYLRVRFHEGSTLSIGEKSIVKIEQHHNEKATIVLLQEGIIRLNVQKDLVSGEMNKVYILTPNGIVAVRGTEFLVHYNKKIKKTSLLTFKGEVDFSYVNYKELKNSSVAINKGDIEQQITRDEDNNIKIENKETVKVLSERKLEHFLKRNNFKSIKAGQFSESVNFISHVSEPILISPLQLNILYRNTDFVVRDKQSDFVKADLVLKKNKTDLKFEKVSTPPAGIISRGDKLFASKPGGFWDKKTGFYIPPEGDSLFLKGAGIFVVKNIGDIDKLTGQYQAPLGISLNSEGFQLKKLKDNTPQELKERINLQYIELSKSLNRNLIVKSKFDDSLAIKPLSKREMIAVDVIEFSVNTLSHKLKTSSDTFASDREYNSDGAKDFYLVWDHSSSRKWQPTLGVGMTYMSYPNSELGSAVQAGERLLRMHAGYRYSLNSKLNILAKGALDQVYLLDHGSTPSSGSGTQTEMNRVTLPRFHFVLERHFYQSGRWVFDGDFGVVVNIPRSPGNFKVGVGYGYKLNLNSKYWWSHGWWVGAQAGIYSEKFSVENTNFEAKNSLSGKYLGIKFGFVL